LPDVNNADYLVWDVFNPNRGPRPDLFDGTLRWAFRNPDYGLIFYQDGYLLFRRGADPRRNVPTLALVTEPQIQYPLRVILEDTVALLGFDLSRTESQLGEPVYLTTYWQSLRPVSRPYLLFIGIPANWRFTDPAHGLYPISEWRPPEIVRDEQALVWPALPDGDQYEIVLGLWYDKGEPRLQSADQLLGRDVIRFATLSVRSGRYTIHPRVAAVSAGQKEKP
jgi:hypothetical protein